MRSIILIISSLILLLLVEQSVEQSRGRISSSRGSQSASSSTTAPRVTPRRPDDNDDEDDDSSDSDEPFDCPRPDGLFADPGNCKRFYLCGSNKAYSQACPPSLYFDDKLKFCTFKTAQLACGPVPEDEYSDAATNQDKLTVCDKTACQLPACFCSDDGTAIPGGLTATQTPQFVLLGFSGAVNELVFEQYKKALGYQNKFTISQTKHNPNGCGIKATFFLNHEYANYAELQWLATQGHEIALSSITHRTPETWWTDTANYSQWAEEVIGMREIILKFANGGSQNGGVLTRDNVVGMRAPYVKPGGDPMFEMAHDFGLVYDTSIVAPRGAVPFWPFTFDHRQPFDCSLNPNKGRQSETSEENRNGRGGLQRNKRDISKDDFAKKKKAYSFEKPKPRSFKSRSKRNSPYLGRPLKCPTRPFPGLWEIPVNPMFNEFNTCPNMDQCVFPSSEEADDGTDIVDFLKENFYRHYTNNRAPFLLNFHVNWFTNKVKVRALNKFIDVLLREYKDVYFVTYQQLVQWMREPQPLGQLNIPCENRTTVSTCNRPHTCVVKHYLDKDNNAATVDDFARSDTRYMPVCHPTPCPQQYPWYNNHAGASRYFKTIMQLVEEATVPEEKTETSSAQPQPSAN